MKHYTVISYGCKEWLCRTGRIPGDLVFHRPHERMTMAGIKEAVCEHFGLSMIEMESDRRSRDVARPRQVSMYLCKRLTHNSLPQIGNSHGNRDHTTVIHAVRQIERFRAEDPELDFEVEALIAELSKPRLVEVAA